VSGLKVTGRPYAYKIRKNRASKKKRKETSSVKVKRSTDRKEKMEDYDKNKQYSVIRMSREGTTEWQQVNIKLQARAMLNKKTQLFAVKVADLPEHYPKEEEYKNKDLYAKEIKRWFARSVSEEEFEIIQGQLWSMLDSVTEHCTWANTIVTTECNFGNYTKSMKAIDQHVLARSGEINLKKKEKLAKLFVKTTKPKEVMNMLLDVAKINAEIKGHQEGQEFTQQELMTMLRCCIRKIPSLQTIEQLSYSTTIGTNTYDTLTTYLREVITSGDDSEEEKEEEFALSTDQLRPQRGACFKCGSLNHRATDCSIQAKCTKCCSVVKSNGYDDSTSHCTGQHDAWLSLKEYTRQRFGSKGGRGGKNGRGRGRGTGKNSRGDNRTHKNVNATTFNAFATSLISETESDESQNNIMATEELKERQEGEIISLFFDNCGALNGTGRRDILRNLRLVPKHEAARLGLKDIGKNAYYPTEKGDLFLICQDSAGHEVLEQFLVYVFPKWTDTIISQQLTDQRKVRLPNGEELRTHQYDSINVRVNRQELKGGKIRRFQVPLQNTRNTVRLIGRIAQEEEIRDVKATVPLTVKSISAELMQKRLAHPPKKSLELVGSGAMKGQSIKDGMRDIPKLQLKEEEIRGSMMKKNRALKNRDPAKYEDKNMYEQWFEVASVDMHGPYSRSITGSRFFTSIVYSTGIEATKCHKTPADYLNIIESFFTEYGRPRHLNVDAGSVNIGGNQDLLGNLKLRVLKHGVALKVAATNSQWENSMNEIRGRYLYEAAIKMCTLAGLPIEKFWAAAVSYKAIINMLLPRKELQNRSYFEIHYGREPFTNHLRVWGCPAYVLIPKNIRRSYEKAVTGKEIPTAFSRHSRRCIFLMTNPSSKPGNYYCYDLETKKVVKSRDVIFDEDFETVTKQPNCKGWDFKLDKTVGKLEYKTSLDLENEYEEFTQIHNRNSWIQEEEEDEESPESRQRASSTEQEQEEMNRKNTTQVGVEEHKESTAEDVVDDEETDATEHPRSRKSTTLYQPGKRNDNGRFEAASSWKETGTAPRELTEKDLSALTTNFLAVEDKLQQIINSQSNNVYSTTYISTSQVEPYQGQLKDIIS
jgi:hypothetical protein